MKKSAMGIMTFVLSMFLTMGCGNGDSDECKDISGTWTIDSHCVEELEGQNLTITQSGCTFTLSEPFSGWEGTVNSAGEVTVTGKSGEQQFTCIATLSGDSLSGSCTPECNYSYSK